MHLTISINIIIYIYYIPATIGGFFFVCFAGISRVLEILSEPHFLRSISHVRSLPTEVISRPRFYRWQWPGRSLDRTPTPRPLVVGRAWWRKERRAIGRSTLLNFNQTHISPCSEISFFLLCGFRQIAENTTWLSTSTEKMSLTSHMDRLLSFGPPHLMPTLIQP